MIYKNVMICGDSVPSRRLQPRLLDTYSLSEINRFQHFKDGSCSCGDFC
uniref:DYW domain-containing protein n=1 Tax=Arundo donax TaxID=35708 RepID=A0A0A9BTC4_ARUDO